MRSKIYATIRNLDPIYNTFLEYLPYDRSRLFLHKRTIELASSNLSIRHIRYIYECLIKMISNQCPDQISELYSFDTFHRSIIEAKDDINSIRNETLQTFSKWELLERIFDTIQLVKSGQKLICHAHVLSHLIPQLCPPLHYPSCKSFFNFDKESLLDNAESKFYSYLIASFFQPISQNEQVINFFMKYQATSNWNTSYPKFINHLVIGSVILQKRKPEEFRPLIEAVV